MVTKVRYEEFSIEFPNFIGFHAYARDIWDSTEGYVIQYTHYPDSGQSGIMLDDSGEIVFLPKKDTVFFEESVIPGHMLRRKMIKILPRNKKARFRVSYAYHQSVTEVADNRNTNAVIDWREWYSQSFRWEGFTPFKQIRDSAQFYFTIPDNDDFEPYRKKTAEKLNLKDTTVVIPGEYDIYVDFTKDGRLLTYRINYIIFKIERFKGSKPGKPKYIAVYYPDSC